MRTTRAIASPSRRRNRHKSQTCKPLPFILICLALIWCVYETFLYWHLDERQQWVETKPPSIPSSAPPDISNNTRWTYLRPDRSGSVLLEMLRADCLSQQQGYRYGGVCGDSPNMNDAMQLAHFLGLREWYWGNCSEDVPRSHFLLEPDTLQSFPESYLENLQGIVASQPWIRRSKKRFTIAVHIRRGDVSPCGEHYGRYLPNSYYQALINRYMRPNAEIHIYSESVTFEHFVWFRLRGYKLHLSTHIHTALQGLIDSDVLILSVSAFSYLAALLTRAKVVYTPFWFKPHPGWDVVNDTKLLTHMEEKRLHWHWHQRKCPNS